MSKLETKTESIQLLNAKQFAAKLGLSKRSIHRMNSCHVIPKPLRIAGSIRWIEAEIDAWILAGCPDRKTWEYMKDTAA